MADHTPGPAVSPQYPKEYVDMEKTGKLKPMPFGSSILFFGIPTAVFYFSIYVVLPFLGRSGVAPILNYSITLMGPVVHLFIASLVALIREGYKLNWDSLKKRFRLKPMRRKEWIWAFGLFVFMVSSNAFLLFTRKWLLTFPFFNPPDYLPSTLNPNAVVDGIPPEFITTPLGLLVMFQLLFLFFNIFGEEFWWRGYILPRQELAFGKRAWVIHGVLWTLFHIFWKWNLIILLPGALAASFVAQKLKNTTVLVVVHLVVNTIGGTILLMLSG
ncbi:MAG: CPBP family intramembrane glutamic endopeptidase [Bacillota bacterium]|nr:CPBP family intramembrane glutamic endopeptidase [Bacillota bacterium]MDW7684810.1 CPBP family intramembrane glutamic endopeptidase [Bacillota bacterium]